MQQKQERKLRGCLGALLGLLPAAALAWLFTGSDSFTGIAGVTGFLLILGGYRLLAGQVSGFGAALAALLAPLAALPGLWYAYAERIFQDNSSYGCTMAEAMELVPTVAFDPINRGQLLTDVGSLVVLDLLCAFLFFMFCRLRSREANGQK